MPNALYTRVIDILVKTGGVSEDQAILNLGRLLRMNNSDENSFTAAQCISFKKNLECIIILRGDKSKLAEARPLLGALT